MIQLYEGKESCCGCTACASVCPKQAISMKPDEDGFLYPEVDGMLCVDCARCKQVCAFQSVEVKESGLHEPIATYAAIHKDESVLQGSASGGVFVALASNTIGKNGVVFGCAMNNEMLPEHVCIDNINGIKKLQGSKYMQSDVKNTFLEVRDYLNSGKHVLYTGTPCQIAGLKSYLGKEYENLTTADLICHGVPSPTFFKGYISWLEKELKATVTDFQFRDKSKGWGKLGKVTYNKNGIIKSKIVLPTDSYYYFYFLKGHIIRKCCYECPYAGTSRTGDFTIGDYWGIQKEHPELDTRRGVSALLINSEKGMLLKDELQLDLIKSTFEQVRRHNNQLNCPIRKSDKRDEILKIFREVGFRAVADRYYKSMRYKIIVEWIKFRVPKPIKSMLKRILS